MKRIALILLFLCLSSGCVYYNTFFNAKRRFQEAEKNRWKAEENPSDRNARRVAEDIYFQAIAKASAVIDLHPNSKWVDDSLLLIGKAEYWRGRYPEALEKFVELQSNFPTSGLLEESRLWQGKASWKMGRYDEARLVLGSLAREGRSGYADQAAYALLEIGMDRKDSRLVISDGRDLLTRLRRGGGGLRSGIHQMIGQAHLSLQEYDLAAEEMRAALKGDPTPRQEFDAKTTLGSILEARGQFGKARDLYLEMSRTKRLRSRFQAEIRLSLAGALGRLDRTEEAYRLYLGITEGFPRTSQSAMAYYRMGLIAGKQHRKPDEVRELFRKAQQEDSSAPAFDLARQRQEDLDNLDRCLSRIAADSTGRESAATMFDLAELYRLRLEEPDSALAAYRNVVAADTTGDLAPKAAYAIAWLYAETKRDTVSAQAAFASLAREYPGTPYAEASSPWVVGGLGAAEDSARSLYLEAERVRFSGAPAAAYLPQLERIVSAFPNSNLAPKALYSIGWVHENVLGDAGTARTTYRTVAEKYGRASVGELARRKLAAIVEEARQDSLRLVARADSLREAIRADSLRLVARTDSLREAARADSLRLTARADSLRSETPTDSAGAPLPANPPGGPAAADTLVAGTGGAGPPAAAEGDSGRMAGDVVPPRLDAPAPLVYPDSLKSGGIATEILLKVRIGTDGRVLEAVLLKGPERYRQAAQATLAQYRYLPGTRGGTPQEMWVDQAVIFPSP